MPDVEFSGVCPQASIKVSVASEADPTAAACRFTIPAPGGTRTCSLPVGAYDVAYEALGTPRTSIHLEVTKNGTMSPVDDTLDERGEAFGNVELTVE